MNSHLRQLNNQLEQVKLELAKKLKYFPTTIVLEFVQECVHSKPKQPLTFCLEELTSVTVDPLDAVKQDYIGKKEWY